MNFSTFMKQAHRIASALYRVANKYDKYSECLSEAMKSLYVGIKEKKQNKEAEYKYTAATLKRMNPIFDRTAYVKNRLRASIDSSYFIDGVASKAIERIRSTVSSIIKAEKKRAESMEKALGSNRSLDCFGLGRAW